MMNIRSRGKHRVQVMREGVCIEDTGFFNNMILDTFFNRLTGLSGTFSESTSSQKCQVGTGTTPAAAGDVALESLLATKSGSDDRVAVYEGIAGGFISYSTTRVFSFTLGSVVGNVSEIGTQIDQNQTGDPIDTRTVLPSTVTVTNQDQLVITHVRFTDFSTTDVTGSITLDSINYDYIIRPCNSAFSSANTAVSHLYNWSINGVAGVTWGRYGWEAGSLPVNAGDSWNGGTGDNYNDIPTTQEVAPSTTLEGKFNVVLAPNQANLTSGIKLMSFMLTGTGSQNMFACQFTPNIPKLLTERLTFNMQITHARG